MFRNGSSISVDYMFTEADRIKDLFKWTLWNILTYY